MKKRILFAGISACITALFLMTGCPHHSSSGGWYLPGGGGGTPGTSYESGGARQTPSQGTVSKQGDVTVKMSEGLQNSAYVVFSQISGAEYDAFCDDIKLDEQLIRYYGTYTYNVPKETNGNTTYTTNSFQNVVRVDALGLKKGQHTIKIAKKGSTNYTEVKLDVLDHDRSGFAFTGAKTPGAYNKDGTLKSGAIVIYLTDSNKSTVEATLGGTKYTGIPAITQAIKAKKISTPVDIRVIGKVTATASGKELSCSDMNSAWALGVKEASEVTIEGVGHDATLYGAGVAAFNCSYIEIANLGLMKWGGGKDGDGIALKGGAEGYIWVHNNDVFYGDAGSDGDQVKGDGSMDLKDDTKYVTIAYNHFWDSGKMSLCGMKSESGPNYITYHHNWFDHSDSRHPRIRTMTVHVYNNYFDGNSKYGVGVTTGASAFVEGNYFRNAHNPMLSSKQGTDALGSGTFSGEKGGVIKSFNNEFAEKNTNGVKFQLITNKYDYTNNKALGAYREWYEDVGTKTAEGYVIYDTTADKFETNSLIAIEDVSVKNGYYQVSSGKTGFYIDVPANVQKVIVKAKCGSSSKTGTANMLSVNGQAVSMDMAADYKDYEFAVSVTEDSTIEIANVHKDNSMNVKEIKVIAASAWRTKLTEGADPTNIDAYEVDNRSDKVPESVKTRSGGTTYSNFDTTMGNTGLGLSANPTGPKAAKTDVLNFAGRHYPDFTYTFNNTVDDASYAKNDVLNNALVGYKTGFSKVQGTTAGGDSSSGGDSGDTGGNTGGGTTDPTPPAEVKPEGFVVAGSYGFSTKTNDESGMTYTQKQIFGSSQSAAGDIKTAYGFAKSCKIDSKGVNLNNKADSGKLVFALDKTLKLTFADATTNGVIISTEDGYIGTSGTKTSDTRTSANKLELGAGTYTVVGAKSSSATILSFTFEE